MADSLEAQKIRDLEEKLSAAIRLIAEREAEIARLAGTKSAGTERPADLPGSVSGQQHSQPQPGARPAVSDTNQSIIRFKRTDGTTNSLLGKYYEQKMLTLVFLRMLAKGYEFQLASNMEAAGKFDDIVLWYRTQPYDIWNSIFVQLKHKQDENFEIHKPALTNLTGDLSLIEYCHSDQAMKLPEKFKTFGNLDDRKIILFTNAGIADSLVCEVKSDALLITGGKAVSFKAGGEVYDWLCEWVDFKKALIELHGQVEGRSEEEAAKSIEEVLKGAIYANIGITTYKDGLIKSPTLVNLKGLRKKLDRVKDKDTYSSFLAKLQVYTNQVHESELDSKIKEQIGKVLKCGIDLEAKATFNLLLDKMKSWWENQNICLTQYSQLWLEVFRTQVETMSKSTIERLTEISVEFKEDALQKVFDSIPSFGIINIKVDSRTAASSLRVHQALAKFRPNEIVLHVNVKALLDREDDVLSAWTSRWCRLLVVECDTQLDQSQAARIGEKIVATIVKNDKLLALLIASEAHPLIKAMGHKLHKTAVEESCAWENLTDDAKQSFLKTPIFIQGTEFALSELIEDSVLGTNDDTELISRLITRDTKCGKDLGEEEAIFIKRRLLQPDGQSFEVSTKFNKNGNTFLLVANSGMGKSIYFKHLANELKESGAWIVHIKLVDCQEYFNDIDKSRVTEEAAWQFLEHFALDPGNILEKFLFRGLKRKLIVFLDGVDEVCPTHKNLVIEFLRHIKNFNLTQLWVSSRPVAKEGLEVILSVKALDLDPFSKDDQVEYFLEAWKAKFSSEVERKQNIKKLLDSFANSLGPDEEILGVPLMTAMIAKVYLGFKDQLITDGRLDKLFLYEKCVDSLVKVLYVEKMQTGKSKSETATEEMEKRKEIVYENHSLAALRALFSDDKYNGIECEGKENFDKKLNKHLDIVSNASERTGIIDDVKDCIPQFSHRSFAEYFAARWLSRNYKNHWELVRKIITNPSHKGVSEMFHWFLAKDSPLHLAILSGELENIQTLLAKQSQDINATDSGGRTPLHLALSMSGIDGNLRRRDVVGTLMAKSPQTNITDGVLGWTPLQYHRNMDLGVGYRYKKSGGAADGAGNDYEHKMLSLVFLRILATGYEFQLASNVEEAGKFDDIVMRYRKLSDDDWNSIFVQLKHKQNKKYIPIPELLGLSGDFSLARYLHSFGKFNDHKIVIFTNAGIADSLVCEVESDPLLDTGGKAVSFKAGGEVFQGLCEWVDIKEALTQLHGQVEGKSEMEVKSKVEIACENINFNNKSVTSFKEELLKTPSLVKLKALLTKLEPVKDKDSYSSFLDKLQVYTNQVHESKLDSKIKEQFGKVCKCSFDLEAGAMLHALKAKVKSWWQKDNFYLTQDSPLWLDIIKSQTETLSKTTIKRLTKFRIEFEESSLKVLNERINEVCIFGGILNLRVDSRTAASSLRVHQALAKFRPNEIVLHVNVKTLLELEDDVLSAWASRWCRLLVVECDTQLDQSQAARIAEKISSIFAMKNDYKLLVLIAPEIHELHLRFYDSGNYMRFNDNCVWNDLTDQAKENILSYRIVINGIQSTLTLSGLVQLEDRLFNKFDLEVISEFLLRDVSCGKYLDDVGRFFVTRRLRKSHDSLPFFVNSLRDVRERVALLVAEPGMGKSTIISHLANTAKTEDPSAWVVHLKLNDCIHFLKDIKVDQFGEREVKRFLENTALITRSSFEKLLFGYLTHKLVVFVDGVDEVCPNYEQQVFKLLSFLKDMKFSRLWVASRPVLQAKLETTLQVKSMNLVAFSEEDRNEFFNKVWMAKVPSAFSENCSEATESVLTLINDSLGKNNPILGVPLMTAMIADIFQERLFSENGQRNDQKNERFDVMNLYDKFIQKKFDIYCVEKKKTQNRELAGNTSDEETLLRRMHHRHRLAALRVLFSREEIAGLQFEGSDRFNKDLDTFLKEVSYGSDKLGIIDNVVDGIPHFVDRSFAEYFAATWLALHFKDNKIFIERIIFDPAYKLVSEMFHRSLAENHPLHVAVFNRDLEAMKRILNNKPNNEDVNELDAGGRTPLHLAVLLIGTDQHPDFVPIVEYLIQEQNASLDVADQVLGGTPLRYAEWSRSWKALGILLENRGGELNKKQEGWPKPSQQLMLDAARGASELVVRYLVEERGGELGLK